MAAHEDEEISRKVELAWLAAFYGGMLTEKQRLVLQLHCEEDLSLGEIAREAGISRQGVHDMLTRTAAKLFEMEKRLGMAERFRRMEQGLEDCRRAIRDKRYDEAERALDALVRLDQEDEHGLGGLERKAAGRPAEDDRQGQADRAEREGRHARGAHGSAGG